MYIYILYIYIYIQNYQDPLEAVLGKSLMTLILINITIFFFSFLLKNY